jgi:hypothetical protein
MRCTRPVVAVLVLVSVTLALTQSPVAGDGGSTDRARGGARPQVYFVNAVAAPTTGGPANLGTPITIYGRGFGAVRGDSRVLIGGVEVARYLAWNSRSANNRRLDRIIVQPGPAVTGGRIVVEVEGRRSFGRATFAPTDGEVYAVSPRGDDTAACSLAAPCATLQHVVGDVMAPGDVVLVRGGTYDEGEVWLRNVNDDGGTAAAPKAVLAYPREVPVFDNAARPFIVEADHITVAGLTFLNGKSLGVPDTGPPGVVGARLIDNVFRGLIGYSAVDLHGDDHQLLGNVCRVSGSTVGTQGHCYYVSWGDGVRIRFNVGAGAPGYGLHVFDQQRQSGDFRRTITGMLIEGNVLASSTERSGLILAMGDEGGLGNEIRGVRVLRNRLTANNHLGMVVGINVHQVLIQGNRFVENGRQGLHVTDDASISGIDIVRNRFVQSDNDVCTSNCSWYEVLPYEIGAAAADVTLADNVID